MGRRLNPAELRPAVLDIPAGTLREQWAWVLARSLLAVTMRRKVSGEREAGDGTAGPVRL